MFFSQGGVTETNVLCPPAGASGENGYWGNFPQIREMVIEVVAFLGRKLTT
jgi:hypothetical protein